MTHAGTMLSPLAASGAESVVATELELLTVFIIAAVVGIAVAKLGRFPYTIALLLAGVGCRCWASG